MNTNYFSGPKVLFAPFTGHTILCILILSFLLMEAIPIFAATAPKSEAIGSTVTIKVDVGNLFSRPFETASVIDTLKAGDSVTLLAKEGKWYVARLQDQRLGWLHERLLADSEPETTSGRPEPAPADGDPEDIRELPRLALRLDQGWVRESPSSDAKPKFTLDKGDIVSVVDTLEGWYFIQLEDGRNGWAYQDLFRPVEDTPEASDDTARRIDSDEAENPQFEAVAKVGSGRVRELPTTNSGIRFGLTKGDTVSVMETRDGWYYIRSTAGQTGWAHNSLFHPPEAPPATLSDAASPSPATSPKGASATAGEPLFQARVQVDSGRVREAPTTESRIKFGILKGESVSVEDTRDGWYFVRLKDDRFGWAHQSLFSLDAEDAPKKIESIRFENGQSGEEKIIFSLNGFHPPKTFALDEEIPKVVCDFIATRLGPDMGHTIPVGGDLVQKIRIGYHESPREKVRVVIDLSPEKKYSVEQVFYKATNTYTLTFKTIGSLPAE